eukprot:6198461-Pleurochrysis_carterae.AAC.5
MAKRARLAKPAKLERASGLVTSQGTCRPCAARQTLPRRHGLRPPPRTGDAPGCAPSGCGNRCPCGPAAFPRWHASASLELAQPSR